MTGAKALPFEVMRVRVATGKFLFQEHVVFLTPHLKENTDNVHMHLEYIEYNYVREAPHH